ncbi:MAG: trigger factor [bacterium]
MKHKIEKLPKSRVKIEITLVSDEFKKYMDEAFEHLSKGVEIEGFRAGKAPRAMLEKKIGKDRIFSHALEHAIPNSLAEVTSKEKIQPVAEPKVAMKKFPMEDKPSEELIFDAEFDILDELKLPDWKKINVKAEKPEKVQTKEVDEVLKNIQQSRAKYNKVDRELKNGDRAEIDFEGKVDNIKVDQLTSKNHPFILGTGYFLPDFEKNIIDMKASQEKQFKITIPKDVKDQFIAGKEVEFKVKINSVEEVILPKLDDKFAQEFGKVKDLKQMKAEIEKSVENRKKSQSHQKTQNNMLEGLASKTNIDIPDSLIEKELDRMLNQIREDIEMRGLTFGDYLNSLNKTEQDLRKDMRGQAEKSVKMALIINEIARNENIQVSDKEIQDEIKKYEAMGQKIERNQDVDRYMQNVVSHRKTIEYLSKILVH